MGEEIIIIKNEDKQKKLTDRELGGRSTYLYPLKRAK